jgi:hypothetical protein
MSSTGSAVAATTPASASIASRHSIKGALLDRGAERTLRPTFLLDYRGSLVGRGGFEPPTNGLKLEISAVTI